MQQRVNIIPVNAPTIVLLADYGDGDPAFTEVMLQLHTAIPGTYIIPQSISKFSTINTGFWIFQIALTKNLGNTYIFANTAPRRDNPGPRNQNEGERLMYAKLENGFEILAVNSGYAFSFVKPYIREFHTVKTENKRSQFRSRDKFPKIVSQMASGDYSFLDQKSAINTIPDYPGSRIAHIDRYGNIKTTMRLSETAKLRIGDTVNISMQGISHKAAYVDGIFSVREKEVAFAPGSSGHDDRFMEIVVRYGSAYELFGKPDIETEFVVSKH